MFELNTYITSYFTCVVALLVLFAVRCPDSDIRIVTGLTLFWPATLFVIALILFLDLFGVKFDFYIGEKLFGFRKGTNPLCRGFAVTVLKMEFQFYKIVTNKK